MTNVNEIVWKDVIGFEGLYQVSSIGDVRRNGKFLKPSFQRYLRVTFSKNSTLSYHGVHRLVAIAFTPNPK